MTQQPDMQRATTSRMQSELSTKPQPAINLKRRRGYEEEDEDENVQKARRIFFALSIDSIATPQT